MHAYYSVIQFLPDALSDERVNIGVVAFGDGGVKVHFLSRWERVKRFGGDVGFLRDFASQFSADLEQPPLPLADFETVSAWREEQIREIAKEWMGAIQLTEPRGSLASVDTLVGDMAKLYLHESKPPARTRDKREASKLAAASLKRALDARFGKSAADFIKRNDSVAGRFDRHVFDVVVRNGEIYCAAQGVSFDAGNEAAAQRDLDATAWIVDDVRKQYAELPVAVVAIPPSKKASKAFGKARTIFDGLKADFVLERGLEEWARDLVPKLSLDLT